MVWINELVIVTVSTYLRTYWCFKFYTLFWRR
uniref:Uncharacterized protein n=1 Tax=Rhizophora mucronata TaxID=61149 RepID=A0A2P2NQA8_RHIMU